MTIFQTSGRRELPNACAIFAQRVFEINRSVLICFLLCLFVNSLHADGPGLPNRAYPEDQVYTVIGRINSANGAPRSHAGASMHKGYLVVIYSTDGEISDGGFSFYDISDPYNPVLVHRKDDEETQEIREAHGYGYSSSYGADLVALQAAYGIQIWDWTEIKNPVRLSSLHLPGIEDSDYALGAWWLFWQAPYIFVGGSGNGVYIVDASDPRNPILAERVAGLPNPVPISQLGGFRVGPIFAVGNLLVASNMLGRGYITMDVSNPINPIVLQTLGEEEPDIYSMMINGNKILGAGIENHLFVYDITKPSDVIFVGLIATNGQGGYLTFQDGFAHIGASDHYAKVDIRDDTNYRLVAKASANAPHADEDFVTVLGNLVLISDDHGNGSFLMPHQAEPDNNGPQVNMVVPRNRAGNQALTTRIGLTFTDLIDLRTVNDSTFIVRPVGGAPLRGKYSAQTGIVNFSPDAPLQLGQTYEIIVPQNGVRDLAGNPTGETFTSTFSTISADQLITCEVIATQPAAVGDTVSFRARSNGGAGEISYSWRFGDGSPATVFSTDSSASHVYTRPGHFAVRVTATDGASLSSAVMIQTIHHPLTAAPPTSSSTIIFDAVENTVWNVNPDNETVTAIDAVAITKKFEVPAGKKPSTLAKAPDGTIWVVSQDDAAISALHSKTGASVNTIALPYASRPFGIAFSPDGSAAYVSLQATGRLLKLDPAGGNIIGNIEVGPAPRGIAITSNADRIFVTRFISPLDHGEIVEVDASSFSVVRTVQLALDQSPDQEDNGRGVPNYLISLAITPDGQRAWVPSKKDNTVRGLQRDGLPLTFENAVRTIFSQIDLQSNAEDLSARRDLNDRDLAIAVQFSRLGDYAFVASQGSNTVDILDAYNRSLVTSLENAGRAPQGLALSDDGNKLFVHSFLSRSVLVYDVSGIVTSTTNNAKLLAEITTVSSEKLPPFVLEGKRIFYNAKDPRMNQDGYLSCASCHLDGDHDGRVWDFTDRGEGLRNTTSLLGRRGTGHGRVHWSANFDEIQDFEHDVRYAFSGTGFMADADFNTGTRNQTLGDPKAGVSPELDALAAYVTSLAEVHPSPYRNPDGSLTPDGAAGRILFQQLKCASCHAGNDFTDSNSGLMHEVGTIKPSSGNRLGQRLPGIDTPTLRDVWETPPYLHDGSAATLMEVLVNSNGLHGATGTLSETQKQQLVAYLLQIDNLEPPAAEAKPAVVITSPAPNALFAKGSTIPIAVEATPVLGSINQVKFFADAAELGADTTAPYGLTWIAADSGTHILTAQIVYEVGIKTLSGSVKIKIMPPITEVNDSVQIAGNYELSYAYPNPFNPSTRLNLIVARQQRVRIEIFNVLGQRIAVLHNGVLAANRKHVFTIDARRLSSGQYLCRASGENFTATRRFTVAK